MTIEEKLLCKQYLEQLEKDHSCTEYQLLMELLEDTCTEQEVENWTPVTKNLPSLNDFYLATIEIKEDDVLFCEQLFFGNPQFFDKDKIGWYFIDETGVSEVHHVIAWRPVPKPYKGDQYE